MNYKANYIWAIAAASALTACSGTPPQVSAKVPLLNEQAQFAKHYVKEELANKLENATLGTVISTQNQELTVAQTYVSALGLPCKRIQLTEHSTQNSYQTAACKSTQGWFIAPGLLPTASYKEQKG